jgi:hypothetical protein
MMRTNGNDRGAVRTATVTWVVIVLAIVGVFGFDGFGIIANRVHTEDNAQTAAYAASQAWHNSPNLTAAYQAAVASIAGSGDTVLTQNFSVDPDGTIHLLVRHTVKTVVFSRIGPLEHLTTATEHGDANSSLSS